MSLNEKLVPLPREHPSWYSTAVTDPAMERLRRWRKGRSDVATRRELYGHEARQYCKRSSLSKVLEHARETISKGASRKDYMFLHRYVLARRPKAVLELGSGVTSIAIADALREVVNQHGEEARGHLYTMENIESYYEHAQTLCPPDVRSYVTYHLSPATYFNWRNQVFCVGYETLPEGPFDLVFVDGPNPSPDKATAIDGDMLRLLEKHPSHRMDIVIDGRFSAGLALSRYVRRGTAFRDNALNLTCFANVRGSDLRRVPRPVPLMPDDNIFLRLDL